MTRRVKIDRQPDPPIPKHGPGQHNCLIHTIAQQIPREHKAAWLRAVAWPHRDRYWLQDFDQALRSVLTAKKPLLYGWLKERIQAAATAHGLEILDLDWTNVAYLAGHRDIAELVRWAHTQPAEILHVVTGVALGYPLWEVEIWVREGCQGPSLPEMLEAQRLTLECSTGRADQSAG